MEHRPPADEVPVYIKPWLTFSQDVTPGFYTLFFDAVDHQGRNSVTTAACDVKIVPELVDVEPYGMTVDQGSGPITVKMVVRNKGQMGPPIPVVTWKISVLGEDDRELAVLGTGELRDVPPGTEFPVSVTDGAGLLGGRNQRYVGRVTGRDENTAEQGNNSVSAPRPYLGPNVLEPGSGNTGNTSSSCPSGCEFNGDGGACISDHDDSAESATCTGGNLLDCLFPQLGSIELSFQCNGDGDCADGYLCSKSSGTCRQACH